MIKNKGSEGYGNLYTPHAGSMIIQVQREGGLANRTIVLGQRAVRFLGFATSRTGMAIGALLVVSWLLFAVEAARVPLLQSRLNTMQAQTARIDTLQQTLQQLQQRYSQVQSMLGLASAPTRDSVNERRPTDPTLWPIAREGFVSRGEEPPTAYSPEHQGVDIAVPESTTVRASGGGVITDVTQTKDLGVSVRMQNANGFETIYGHLSSVLVHKGDVVAAGQPIALSGNTGSSTAPHLHFEVHKDGRVVDPLQIVPGN